MQFQVPQYIEKELKIVGPLTFRQTLFVGGGALGCLILYVLLAQKSFFLFIVVSIIVVTTGLSLAFVKIEGRSLPTMITNVLLFSVSTKTFLWKRKIAPPKMIKATKPKSKEKEKEKKTSLKINEGSQLQSLATKLETGMR